VLKKAVAKEPDNRYNSAHTLTRALEDVTLRVEGAEDLTPYPGLASFTEEDADYFFGREAEIEQMWRKLDRPHLLGIVGPSGAGKSSFIRAGVIPNAGAGWAIVTCNPENAAFRSLRQELASELAGDADALRELVDVEDLDAMVSAISRWRRRHEQALLIVDQFEELFTLNSPEVQSRFAELLGRLVLEADVFVLLSMRDDFFFHCHQYEALNPVVTDLTLLGQPAGAALRRALVQPATKCGYRFEDGELVDEVLSEVEGERGALPLLAFAMSRLWEKRDRENGLLTRRAYHDIGGVGGALARHAEATLEKIGVERLAIVRELFRNLVTAEGTRAVRHWDELLSVFDRGDVSRAGINPAPTAEMAAAEEVLRDLIDARLLTSYEVRDDEHDPTRRVEIIHESLLANWPRLVRWQTQDQEGAQLRDELRQSAQSWHERGRHDDRLWTGTAYREFALWRERYPGGLTEIEELFAAAMTSFANRRRRRRRLAAVAAVIVIAAVAVVFAGLWRRSVEETRRAEASKLLTLGHVALSDERTQALAYAIASLEFADTPEARRLALKALWAGPPATLIPTGGGQRNSISFAPDGSKMAVGFWDGLFKVFSRHLDPTVVLYDFEGKSVAVGQSFSLDARHLVGTAWKAGGQLRVWETDGWQLEHVLEAPNLPDRSDFGYGVLDKNGAHVLSMFFQGKTVGAPPSEQYGRYVVHRVPIDGGKPELLGTAPATISPIAVPDLTRGLLAVGMRNELHIHRLEALGREPPRIIGRHPEVFGNLSRITFDPVNDRVAVCDAGGNLLVWPIDGSLREPERRFHAPGAPTSTAFNHDGKLLAHSSRGGWLWDLDGPVGAEPLRIGPPEFVMSDVAFTSDGHWLATASQGLGLALWPLKSPYYRLLRGHHKGGVRAAVFAADGSRLFTQGMIDGIVLSWDLSAGAGIEPAIVFQTTPQPSWGLAVDPEGRFLVYGGSGALWKVPLDGGEPMLLEGFANSPKVDPSGRYLVSNNWTAKDTPRGNILDLETGERWLIDPPGEGMSDDSAWSFDQTGRLLVTQGGVVSRWDPQTQETEILFRQGYEVAHARPDGSFFMVESDGTRVIVDIEQDSRIELPESLQSGPSYQPPLTSIIVTANFEGEITVGPVFGGSEPHLLLGHDGIANLSAVSPDGKWVASYFSEGTVHLWPIPDLGKPPLHTLPFEELMSKLKALTNLRVVPDEESHTGYAIEPDFTAYRGWATVPEW
jgi:WD40 repeat protein